MYTHQDFETIKDIIMHNVPGLAGIYLFGSYAQGTQREGSDMDIMILLEKEYEWRQRHEVLNRIYRDTAKKGYVIDFVLKTFDNFEHDKDVPSISRTVFNNGKLLWTKN